MKATDRFTSADLAAFPDNDGKRYEIIDGELFVSKQPHRHHQDVCFQAASKLQQASSRGEGRAYIAPGVIFADDDDVAPDIIWISSARVSAFGPDGHLHGAPELIVEVLSPGKANERRDKEAKLDLYSRRGVSEYWIVDWRARLVEIFRRKDSGLVKVATLTESDTLTTPLLPALSCRVAELFMGIPKSEPN